MSFKSLFEEIVIENGQKWALNTQTYWLKECLTSFSTSIFFMIRIHLAPDIKAKVFSNFVSISPRYSIIKLENSESPTSKLYRLSKSTFYYFNDRRISPDCSFKSNLRQVEFSIMTLQCAV